MKTLGLASKFAPQLLLLAVSLFFIFNIARYLPPILGDQADIGSLEKGVYYNPSDAELHSQLANIYSLLMIAGDDRVKSLYETSLMLSPLMSSSWLGLSELLFEQGDSDKAVIALKRGLSMIPASIGRLWEASMLALRLDERALAVDGLRLVAKSDPERRERVFDISWQLIGDSRFILNEIVSDEILPDYLNYLARRDKIVEALAVWKRIEKAKIPVSDNFAFSYMELLVRKNSVSEAYSVWTARFGLPDADTLVWNGGFERDPLGGGFDWQISRVDGARVDFSWLKKSSGNKSLRLRFDGNHNVDFYHVFQFVPVKPGADYLLSSRISTDGVTTRNGLGWEVVCFPAFSLFKSSATVVGTTDWEELELNFRAPSDCRSVVVRLRRFPSDRIDRNIAGMAWVDDVKLVRLKAAQDARSGN
ncbi:MAG: tetratricopeptide repeat protein [Deltaproteobacteria bacterium]